MHTTSIPPLSLTLGGTMPDLEEGDPSLPARTTSTSRAASNPVSSALRLELPRPGSGADTRQQSNALAVNTNYEDAPIREPIRNIQRSNAALKVAGIGLTIGAAGATLLGLGLRHGVPHPQKFVQNDPHCWDQFGSVSCLGSWKGDASQNVPFAMMVGGATLVTIGGGVAACVMTALCCRTQSQASQPTGATSGSPSGN